MLIKHYKISYGIKYSVRDLIYDVHYCTGAANRRYAYNKATDVRTSSCNSNPSDLWIPIHTFFYMEIHEQFL